MYLTVHLKRQSPEISDFSFSMNYRPQDPWLSHEHRIFAKICEVIKCDIVGKREEILLIYCLDTFVSTSLYLQIVFLLSIVVCFDRCRWHRRQIDRANGIAMGPGDMIH